MTSKTIWKFILEITDEQTLLMPTGAKVLSLQMQGGVPCLWAVVTPEVHSVDPVPNGPTTRTFATYGTGHVLPDDPGTFVGTYQLPQRKLVFHVFER